MASCSLGAQGRLACPGATCPEDTFAVTCEDIEQVSITSLVDLGKSSPVTSRGFGTKGLTESYRCVRLGQVR